MFNTALPIDAIASELKLSLTAHDQLILQAEPGAGKTTRVPLFLLDEPWLRGRKIIMLEPRRLAARASAERMAETLGERVGETVGYRVRLDTKVSRKTRIEVVTEGILTRMLQSDPSLDDVGLVIFDEFHERSLDADLALALLLQSRELLRDDDPLKILVMSATLAQAPLADMLDAPVIQCQGRSFPVTVAYCAGQSVSKTVTLALQERSGSILVFLPGEREIRQTQQDLKNLPTDILVTPLYGNLSLDAQRRAIAPAPKGRRKVVLATSIAETSLTIEGIEVVVDSGLSRQPAFDPRTGMTRLKTVNVSKAASIQRQGRAGRIAPGHCYRLWSKEAQDRLAEHAPAEILQADLAPLALQLLAWGIAQPNELKWLNLPPAAAWQQAIDLLAALGAQRNNVLTDHGKRMSALPAHPRIAHMLLTGLDNNCAILACELAALVGDRTNTGISSTDISEQLLAARRQKSAQFVRSTKQFARLLAAPNDSSNADSIDNNIGLLIAAAWPDRIAKRRGTTSTEYQMANGRAATLRAGETLQKHEWLAVAEVGGRAGQRQDVIYLAAPIPFVQLQAIPRQRTENIKWDAQENRLRAELVFQIGQIVVDRKRLDTPDENLRQHAIFDWVQRRGLSVLEYSNQAMQLQRRVQLMRELEGDAWPDFSEAALLNTLDEWLSPWLNGVSTGRDLGKVDVSKALAAMLPWELSKKLDEQLPLRMEIPSGSSASINYEETPPVVAAKLQEFFGLKNTPALAQGRIPLQIHLLSPAGRPLAITQDLSNFWANVYSEVKKETKGRYPKHPWPNDPLSAAPTKFTKRKIANS